MADTSLTLVVDQTDPLEVQGRGGKELLKKVVNHLDGFLGGSKRATSIQVFADGANPVAASATLTLASCAAGTVVEVNGVPFTALNGTATVANNEFDMAGTDTVDATALAAAINNSTSAAIANVVTASSAAAVVTVSADQKGALGNGVTLKSLGVVATGTVTYSSSSGAQTCTINGVAVTAPTGATDALMATSLASSINGASNALHTGHVRALARAGVCHVFAKYGGPAGNAITLAVTGTGATASGARLTGGVVTQGEGAVASGTVTIAAGGSGNYTVTVNGVATGNVAWNTDEGTTAAAVKVVFDALTSALVMDHVNCTVAAGVLTVTALKGGVAGNAITLACSGTGATASGARLTGGAAPTTVVASAERLASGAGGAVAVSTINL